MSYIRVIPRDLFNEANLLKCLGRVYLNLETANVPGVTLEHDGEAFDIQQDSNDGYLSANNVLLKVGSAEYPLWRPLNSRDAWPLYLYEGEHGDEVEIFDAAGNFSDEFMTFIRGAK